jgi:alcohol dehydrogenase class IV
MRFEFATATRIIFGEGTAATIPDLVSTLGTRPMVVTGASTERASWLVSALGAESFAVPGEPTVELVREGARHVQSADCDVIVAIGGGSAIDAGKAIAAIATNGGEPLDFLEVVGKGRAINMPPLPFIAVPTTAGTGSEVTRNAVLDGVWGKGEFAESADAAPSCLGGPGTDLRPATRANCGHRPRCTHAAH